jgi:PiT family inorganic phosphate transporter
VLGLAFEFVNGFHDAANAVATVIATRVLPPLTAVLMAGALNFLGAVSGTAVATTVGTGIVDPTAVTQATVVAGLLAAIVWDLITWYFGIPTSSSHALLFGVLGAGVATAGVKVVVLDGVTKTGIGIFYSPLIAMAAAALVLIAVYWLSHRQTPSWVSATFGRLQLLSSVYMAFSHGSNDGQKTMGVIALALFTYGALGSEFYVPLWVIGTCALAMADDGLPLDRAAADRGLRRRDRGRHGHRGRDAARRADQHHPRDQRRDHRRWLGPQPAPREVADRRAHRRGLGLDVPRRVRLRLGVRRSGP